MIHPFSIGPGKIKIYTELHSPVNGREHPFPVLSIDANSYVVGLSIQSNLNFDFDSGVHCIQIGKVCALAEGITFMIDLDHDYKAVIQNVADFLGGSEKRYIKRKGSILLQNDVWLGHGVTVMGGVTLHNGCAVAANSVITKDVPPYAIVGGNPARILKYRFDEAIINALLKIAWWDWSPDILKARSADFFLPASEFVKKYLPEAEKRLCDVQLLETEDPERNIVLLIPDVESPYPLYPHILEDFFKQPRPNCECLIYLPQEESAEENIARIVQILQNHTERDCYVTLQVGATIDEHSLFALADYYVATRDRLNIYRTGLADLYNVNILYGTDQPVFPKNLTKKQNDGNLKNSYILK